MYCAFRERRSLWSVDRLKAHSDWREERKHQMPVLQMHKAVKDVSAIDVACVWVKTPVFVLQHFFASHLKKNFHTARMPCSAHYLIRHSRHLHRGRRFLLPCCSLHFGQQVLFRCLAKWLGAQRSEWSEQWSDTCCITLEKLHFRIF